MPRSHPRPWHRGSLFGAGPRRPLDRNQRARFRYLLNAHARANRLPAKQEKVGLALLKRLGVDGQCDPTKATLADDVGCDMSTVERATKRMRELGLLTWQRRLVRSGWRTEQTSNAYVLLTNAAPPVILPRHRCDRQNAGETLCTFDSRRNRSGSRTLDKALRGYPAIQAPLRSVAEQLAALAMG